MRFRSLALPLVCLFAACGTSPSDAPPDASPPEPPSREFKSNCTVGAPNASEAKRPAGHLDDRSAILPGGRKVTPSGRLLEVGGFPINLRVLPGDRYAVVTDDAVKDQALVLVDLEARDPDKPVVQSLAYPVAPGNSHAPGLFFGLALTNDGRRLFVSNGGHDPIPDDKPKSMHYNTIEVFDVVTGMDGVPQLRKDEARTLRLMFTPQGNDHKLRLPSGMVLSSDEKLLYVACQGDSSLAIVSLEEGKNWGLEIGTARVPGLAPYDVAVDEASKTAFVSLWGGLRKGAGQYIEGVVPVDISNARAPVAAAEPIPTGKAAEAELYLSGRIYVANADADTISIIDAASRKVRTERVTSSMILGAAPNHLAIDSGAPGRPGRIYIANANENAVVALDLDTFKILGHVPTGWYPTAVTVRADGGLVVASARGLGTGPLDGNQSVYRTEGLLQVLPRPSDEELKQGTEVVLGNLIRPRIVAAQLECPEKVPVVDKRFPVPPELGAPSPIKHVFFIVRENKTYDSVFGDLGIGNGDPKLMTFTAEMIPNARKLAKDFVLLDNFYVQSELSLQGHMWTTGCIVNDYVSKGWGATDDYGRGYRPTEAFSVTLYGRLAYPGSDSIWVHLDKQGIRYHNFGEVTNLLDAKTVLDPAYPGLYFNNDIPDVKKAAYVIDYVMGAGDDLEAFHYILLPNDHTSGTKIGASHPASQMADNDEALGRVIDAISHSPLWEKSLIVAVQDDPGGGGDHVEQHRSLSLLASPWIKRNYISSTIYDIASVYRTIGLILGFPPLNVYDANAAPMYELFTDKPDLTPWTFLPRTIPETKNTKDDPMAEECTRADLSKPDQVDLSRVLWKVTHGRDAEPPWQKQPRPRWTKLAADLDDDE